MIGIGLIFVIISIFEMSRGMWIYHTLAHASKEATRFLIVHGPDCQKHVSCAADATFATMANRVQYHGAGLVPTDLQIQVYANGTQILGSGGGYVTLSSLSGSTGIWSATTYRGQPVQVGLRYPFRSALAMFWPGTSPVRFSLVNLGANSWDTMQF